MKKRPLQHVADSHDETRRSGLTVRVSVARPTARMVIAQPFEVTDTANTFDVVAKVSGGGISAQASAIRHAISRALCEAKPDLRPKLKRAGYLTRDPREVERKKYGRHKARKRPQYSKR